MLCLFMLLYLKTSVSSSLPSDRYVLEGLASSSSLSIECLSIIFLFYYGDSVEEGIGERVVRGIVKDVVKEIVKGSFKEILKGSRGYAAVMAL